jgi:hypothetical protein
MELVVKGLTQSFGTTTVLDRLDLETGELRDFVRVESDLAVLAPPAAEAKAAYDDYLREQYDLYLASNASEMRQMLGAG